MMELLTELGLTYVGKIELHKQTLVFFINIFLQFLRYQAVMATLIRHFHFKLTTFSLNRLYMLFMHRILDP